jgi:ParB family chromosome partitioning protein
LAKVEGISRNVDAKNVATLIESFREAGQTAAILVVREENDVYRVLSGSHRVEAARELGWDQIDAIVLDRDERGLRLVEIAENLHRRELTVLERARLVDAWTKLVRQEAAQVEHPVGGRQPNDRGLSKTATSLGLSRAEATRSALIASMPQAVMAKAIELDMEDNQAALLKVAKLPTLDLQIAKLYEISENRNAPRKGGVTCKQTGSAAKSARIMSPGVEAPELPREGEQRREDSRGLPPEFPDLPRELERRSLEAQFKKISDEWCRSDLREMLISAPIEARDRFIWELLFADFPDAFVKALPRKTEGGSHD